MQIVIDLSEKLYKATVNGLDANEIWNLRQVIANGTHLPKEYGRLIDADALNRKDVNCANVPMNFIDAAPTILKPYKAESGELDADSN